MTIECFELDHSTSAATGSLKLCYDVRNRSRAKATAENGDEVAWFLPRGTVLNQGDRLKGRNGEVFEIHAAPEKVSCVTSDDTLLLTRAAYHLGNRHVKLEVGRTILKYQHDHVLDDMVRGLGLEVKVLEESFQPEEGAYHDDHGGGHGGHSH